MISSVAALLGGTVFAVTWIVVSLVVDGELLWSRLLPGVVGGIAFAAVYYLRARRAARN